MLEIHNLMGDGDESVYGWKNLLHIRVIVLLAAPFMWLVSGQVCVCGVEFINYLFITEL